MFEFRACNNAVVRRFMALVILLTVDAIVAKQRNIFEKQVNRVENDKFRIG